MPDKTTPMGLFMAWRQAAVEAYNAAPDHPEIEAHTAADAAVRVVTERIDELVRHYAQLAETSRDDGEHTAAALHACRAETLARLAGELVPLEYSTEAGS